MVIPPVDRNLLPAADRKALLQDGGAQGRGKALRLHATYHAQNSACARCSSSPCPLGAWEVAIEPQLDRSIAPSTHVAVAAVAKGLLVSRSSPERALRQRAGGGTSPRRGPLRGRAWLSWRAWPPTHAPSAAAAPGSGAPGGGAACGIFSDSFSSKAISPPAKKPCSAAKWVSSGPRGGGRVGSRRRGNLLVTPVQARPPPAGRPSPVAPTRFHGRTGRHRHGASGVRS